MRERLRLSCRHKLKIVVASLPGRAPCARFVANASGSVAFIFGLMYAAMILGSAAAIDFHNFARTRTQIQAALDSASLAGATAAGSVLRSGGSIASAKTAGDGAAQTYFSSGVPTARGDIGVVAFDPGSSVGAAKATYAASATIEVRTSILKIISLPLVRVRLTSSAASAAGKYVDVYLMVDISGSMLIGATDADMDKLTAKFGCVFACHDGATNVWNGSFNGDSYQWALNNGVSLRYQLVQSGVVKLVNYMRQLDPANARFRLALYSFDQDVTQVRALSQLRPTNDFIFPEPAVDSDETAGATWFNENISSLVTGIGTGGDGSSSDKPMKLLIIATDGVQDPGRYWTYKTWLRPLVKGFDVSFCDKLKANNVKIGIINTPYLPMTWDWGYNATLGQPGRSGGTRLDDIEPDLKSCAGGLFISASNSSSIQSAFTTIFQASDATRLVQ